jgi:hypothetical protein
MGGDISLQKIGFENRSEILKLRSDVEKELLKQEGISQPKDLSSKSKKVLTNYEDVIKQFLGQTTLDDASSGVQEATHFLNKAVRFGKLGSSWISMIVEAAQVTHAVGVKSMFKSIPQFKDFLKGYSGGQADEAILEMRSYLSLSENSFILPNSVKFEELQVDDIQLKNDKNSLINSMQNFYKSSDKALTAGQEFTFQLGGVKSFTGLLEQMYATSINKNLVSAIDKDNFDPALAKEMGWSDETLQAIVGEVKKHATPRGNLKADLMGLSKWNPDTRLAYIMGLRRNAQILVQRSIVGDNIGIKAGSSSLIKNSVFGQMALSLKSYMLTSHSKQLSRGLMNFDKRKFTQWSSVVAASMVAYSAKQYLKAPTDSKEDRKAREEAFKFENIAKGTFSSTSFSGLIPSAIDIGTVPLRLAGADVDPVFSTGSRGIASSIPAIDIIEDVGRGDTHEIIKNFTPNIIGMNLLHRRIEEALGNSEEARRERRRRRRERD